MIRLENLTKVFPGTEELAVDDLSMDIYEGEIVVLVGPSGCGKTTTMKMINRIIGESLEDLGRPVEAVVDTDANLYTTLDTIVISHKGSAVVVNDEGTYEGVVDFDRVLEVIDSMRNPDQVSADREEAST
jgi:ABC-type glutathione transport system ATPase component